MNNTEFALAQLARDKEQMQWMRRERETASEQEREWLDEDIRTLARKIEQLQTWIDGGRP